MKSITPVPFDSIHGVHVISDTPGDIYHVQVPDCEYIAICFGQDIRKPAGRRTYPNLTATVPVIHEFKHYLPSGGKFWTSRAGVNFWFVFPRSIFSLLPERGYSYVKLLIGGVPVTLNASCGSIAGGCEDYFGGLSSALVGHSVASMRKLAALAVIHEPTAKQVSELVSREALDLNGRRQFNQKAAAIVVLPALLAKHKEGVSDINIILDGESVACSLQRVVRNQRRVARKPTSEELSKDPRTTRVIAITEGSVKWLYATFPNFGGTQRFRVNQVDWVATARLNGISVPLMIAE